MKHSIVFIGLWCMIAFNAFPQHILTIDDCHKLALSNNYSLKISQNNVIAAKEEQHQAFTNYFPVVSATGVAFQADKGMAELSVTPDMSLSMLKNGRAGSITAVQPVFTGGQIANGNRLAKLGVEVNRLKKEQTEKEIALTVEQYFWQVVALQEKLKTIQSVDTMLNSLCHDVTTAVSAGIVNRNDLLQVQLKKSSIAVDSINIVNDIELGKMLLAQYIGLEYYDFDLSYNMAYNLPARMPDSLYFPPLSALPQTTEYTLLQKNVEANKLKVRMAIGKNLPKISVGAGYMYHNFLDTDRSFGIVFASVAVPISSWWGGSHEIRKQKIQAVNAEYKMQDQSQKLLIRIQQAWNDLENAYKQLSINYASIEQAKENLRLNTDYYHAGTVKINDLLEAQSLYQQSLDKYTDAYCAYRIKTVEYMQVTGRK